MRFQYDITPAGIVVSTRRGANLPAELSAKHGLEIAQGATAWLLIALVNGDASNAAWPLDSGFTATFSVRRNLDDASALITASMTCGAILPNLWLRLTAAQTAALDFTGAVFAVDLTYTADGSVMRVLSGPVRLVKGA